MNRSRSAQKAVGVFYVLNFDKSLIAAIVVFVAVFACIDPAIAQINTKISGYVYDASDGHPIAQARVYIVGTSYLSLTDRSGFYRFENVPEGRYLLNVIANSYEKSQNYYDVSVVTDITRQVDFHLRREVYDMGEIEVKGIIPLYNTSDIKIIDRKMIDDRNFNDLADVLNAVEGVFIQRTGPTGSRVRVSIRGSDPKHVLVLLDGQRLNPAGSGEADLSTIPLEMVERIEIYRGGASARFGSDAIGGAIKIITHMQGSDDRPKLSINGYQGKWDTRYSRMVLLNPLRLKKLKSKFTVGYRAVGGEFDYDYWVSPDVGKHSVGTRANADIDSRNFFGTGRYMLSRKWLMSFSSQYYLSHLGLPGSTLRPDSTARKTDKRLLSNFHFQFDPSKTLQVEILIGLSRFQQYFDNSNHPRPAVQFESKYVNDIFNSQAIVNLLLFRGNEARVGLNFQRDILYHDNIMLPDESMGRVVRDNVGWFVSDQQEFEFPRVLLWDQAALDVSIRWDNTDTKKDSTSEKDLGGVRHYSFWSKKAGLSFSGGHPFRVIFRTSYGTSYRLPSMNALFWKGDVPTSGNPELRPETAEHSDAGMEIGIEGWIDISAGITYFHTYVKDLVVWQQVSQGHWGPRNLDAALMTGHEDFVHIGLFDDRLQLRYQNTITVAKNRKTGISSFNKHLTYRPHYVTNLECRWQWWKLHSSYQIRIVDLRYALEANTKWYDAYRIDDFDFGFKSTISNLTVDASYQVKNLRNEHYVLISRYPMPGREWGIEISLAYILN